jgi:hypothetical protein
MLETLKSHYFHLYNVEIPTSPTGLNLNNCWGALKTIVFKLNSRLKKVSNRSVLASSLLRTAS